MDENELEDGLACQLLLLAACDNSDEESEEESDDEEPPVKRTHSCWVRDWILERDDADQNNTIYKLQRQLEEVCRKTQN